MRPRMSVEDEWKSRLKGRQEKMARSRAKGSAGLPPSPGGRSSGSIANRSPSRRTTGKHNAH